MARPLTVRPLMARPFTAVPLPSSEVVSFPTLTPNTMRTRFTLLLVLTGTLFLSAQDTSTVAAYLPSGSVRIARGQPDNPVVRYLTSFYQTVIYPRNARAYGITGAVLVTYTIDTTGQLTVVDTEFRDPNNPDHRPANIEDGDILTITAYSVGGSEGPPEPTSNRNRLLRGQADLREEVARTLRNFPRFEPARRGGRKVEDTQAKLIYFTME